MFPLTRMLEYGNIRKDNNTGTRTQIFPSISPSARFSFGYTSLDNYCYMYGGAVLGNDYNNEFWRFNMVTETWEQLASGVLAMHGSGLAGYNGKIYMFGGYTGTLQNRFLYTTFYRTHGLKTLLALMFQVLDTIVDLLVQTTVNYTYGEVMVGHNCSRMI